MFYIYILYFIVIFKGGVILAIYKDKKRGTYYVSVYVELKNGERKRILKRGFATKREAKHAESEIVFNAAIDNPDNPFFNDVLDEYLKWYEKRRKESSTYRLKGAIKLYIRPSFGNKKIQEITKRDIVRFHNQLLENLSISTVKGVHKDLSAILNYGIQMEYLLVNVAREVGNIDIKDNKKVDYWTLEEFKRFLTVVNNDKYVALFMLLFYSGARIGEVLALTWNDIDFKNNHIDINKRYYNLKTDEPKTESSARIVKMPNHTINLLRQFKLKHTYKDDYVIFGEFYKPMNQSSINIMFHKYLNYFTVDGKQTLKRIRLHDFRHSHASYLINRGYDIQIISKRLGHNKISTTYDIYAHLYPNKEDEAVSKMEDDFKPSDIIKLIK